MFLEIHFKSREFFSLQPRLFKDFTYFKNREKKLKRRNQRKVGKPKQTLYSKLIVVFVLTDFNSQTITKNLIWTCIVKIKSTRSKMQLLKIANLFLFELNF